MASKKKFINVELPILEDNFPILGTPEELNKKTIKLDLSRKLKGKGLEVTFLILNKEGKLFGYPKTQTLMRSYVQRVMRKRINYVEDSIPISCKDIPARIKPFLITRKKVSRAIRNNLRKTAREFLIEYAKQKTFMELSKASLYGEIQKEMYPKLKKVYPLSLCEIRILETAQIENADLTTIKEEEIIIEEEKTQAEEIEESKKETIELKAQDNNVSSEEQKEKPKKTTKKKKEEKEE